MKLPSLPVRGSSGFFLWNILVMDLNYFSGLLEGFEEIMLKGNFEAVLGHE